MKKISHLSTVSSVMVLTLIIPQIAFAAWWNPLSWFNSWSFFHREDTKAEVSESVAKKPEGTTAPKKTTATTSFKPIAELPASTPTATGENFREVAITTYGKGAEFFKRAINDTRSTNIPDIKARRAKLVSRLNLIKSVSFPNSGDGAILNQMFALYAEQHTNEITYIDGVLAYIESNLTAMSNYQAEYERNMNSLLADDKRFVSIAEIQVLFEHEKNFNDTKYQGVLNIIEAIKRYYQNVINQEDEYAKDSTILKAALAKVSESSTASNSYYQPIPVPQTDPYSYLTARQQLLLNPITCSVDSNLARTTVMCR